MIQVNHNKGKCFSIWHAGFRHKLYNKNNHACTNSNIMISMSGKYTLFILVENYRLRRTLAHILERAGCAVMAADPPQEGLAKLKKSKVDLIIFDLDMPDLDGYALLPFLQEICPGIPIIAITDQAYPGLARDLWQKGIQGYLPKPIDAQCILAQVYTLLLERLVPDAEAAAGIHPPNEKEMLRSQGPSSAARLVEGERPVTPAQTQMPPCDKLWPIQALPNTAP